MNKTLKPATPFLILLGIAAISVSAGCGQAPGQPVVGTGTVSTDGTSSGGTSGSSSSTSTNRSPNYDFHFQIMGAGTASQLGGAGLTVNTNTLLQVVLTAGQGMQDPGTGFTPGFNCQWFNVKVGNVSQAAAVRKTSYTDFFYNYMGYDPCQGLPTSWTFDFSSALGVQHTGSTNISINGAQYDNCRTATYGNYDGKNYGGCGQTGVYYSDYVDGYLQVFTD